MSEASEGILSKDSFTMGKLQFFFAERMSKNIFPSVQYTKKKFLDGKSSNAYKSVCRPVCITNICLPWGKILQKKSQLLLPATISRLEKTSVAAIFVRFDHSNSEGHVQDFAIIWRHVCNPPLPPPAKEVLKSFAPLSSISALGKKICSNCTQRRSFL